MGQVNTSKYEQSASLIANAGLSAVPDSNTISTLFSYHLESALDYEMGAKIHALSSSIAALINSLRCNDITSPDKAIDGCYTDSHIWLDFDHDDCAGVVFWRGNTNFLVLFYKKPYMGTDVHRIEIRRIYNDYEEQQQKGNYMLGTWTEEVDAEHGYLSVLTKAKTAVTEYSDDVLSNYTYDTVARPCLRTFSRANDMRLEGNPELWKKLTNPNSYCGFVASMKHCNLANKPIVSSAMRSIESGVNNAYTFIAESLPRAISDLQDKNEKCEVA